MVTNGTHAVRIWLQTNLLEWEGATAGDLSFQPIPSVAPHLPRRNLLGVCWVDDIQV